MEGRGRSRARKQRWFSPKRLTSFLLAAAMVCTNIGSDLSTAYAAGASTDVTFEMRGADLTAAVEEAIALENVVAPDDLNFTNGNVDDFNGYLFGEGKLYEAYPEMEGGDVETNMRVFVRVPEDADDMYAMTGDEEVIFLYINNSEDTVQFRSRITYTVNGEEKVKTTDRITVRSYESVYGDEEVNVISEPVNTEDTAENAADTTAPSEPAAETPEAENPDGQAPETEETEAPAEESPEADAPETEAPAEDPVATESEMTASISKNEAALVAAPAEKATPSELPEEEETTEAETEESAAAEETGEEPETEAPEEEVPETEVPEAEAPETAAPAEDPKATASEMDEATKSEIESAPKPSYSDLVGIGWSGTAKLYTSTLNKLHALDDVEGWKVEYSITPAGSARIVDGPRGVEDGEDLYFGVKNQIGYAVETVLANGEELTADTVTDNEDGSQTAWYAVYGVTEEQSVDVVMAETGEHPAFEQTITMDDGMVITLKAGEGVLPEGVTATAERVSQEVEATVIDNASEEGKDIVTVYLYDINLWLGDQLLDSEIWGGSKKVEVTFSGAPMEEATEEASTVEVLHVETVQDSDQEAKEKAATQEEEIKAEDVLGIETVSEVVEVPADKTVDAISFEAEHFTVYGLAVARANREVPFVDFEMSVGETVTVKSDHKSDGRNSDQWSSNTTGVVTIDKSQNGRAVLSAKSAGSARITHRYYDEGGIWGIGSGWKNETATVTVFAEGMLKVEWYVNGEIVETDYVEEGTQPSFDQRTPERTFEEGMENAEFKGWATEPNSKNFLNEEELSAVTEDTKYYAIFTYDALFYFVLEGHSNTSEKAADYMFAGPDYPANNQPVFGEVIIPDGFDINSRWYAGTQLETDIDDYIIVGTTDDAIRKGLDTEYEDYDERWDYHIDWTTLSFAGSSVGYDRSITICDRKVLHVDGAVILDKETTAGLQYSVTQPDGSIVTQSKTHNKGETVQINSTVSNSGAFTTDGTSYEAEKWYNGQKYQFDGWYTDFNYTVKAQDSIVVGGPQVFYARYVKIDTYRVIYDWGNPPEAVTGVYELPVNRNRYAEGEIYSIDDTEYEAVNSYDEYGNINGEWTFSGWTDPNNGVMGNADVTVSGEWIQTYASYKVEYYYQNAESGVFERDDTQTAIRTGRTDAEVSVTDADKTPTSEDKHYVLNEEMSSEWSDDCAADGSTVLRVYFKLQYTVTYEAGEHGSIGGSASQTVDWGASTTEVTAEAEDGYHFVKWSDDNTNATRNENDVKADATYTATFAPDEDTKYTVEYWYQNAESGNYEKVNETTRNDGTTDAEVSVTDADKTPTSEDKHYVLNEEMSSEWSDDCAADGSTVLRVYFKLQYTVTYEAGEHGSIGGSASQTVDWGASTTEVTAEAEDGYHFVKWSDDNTNATRNENDVKADATYTATFAPDEDTKYTVEYWYQNAESGNYEKVNETTRNDGTTDAEVSVTDADKTPTSEDKHYVLNEEMSSEWSDDCAADGSTVLRVYFKLQYTVTYEAGEHGSIGGSASQTVDWGASTTEVTAEAEDGYHFVKWSDENTNATRNENDVKADATYTAHFEANAYTIRYNKNLDSAEGEMDDQSMVYDQSAALTANAFAADGYTFMGWALQKDGPVVYADQEIVNNLTTEENGVVNLYAIWSDVSEFELTGFDETYDGASYAVEITGPEAGDTVYYYTKDSENAEYGADSSTEAYSAMNVSSKYVKAEVYRDGIMIWTGETTAVINPRNITITVNNAEKYYGEVDPVFSGSITSGSLVNENDLGDIGYSRTNAEEAVGVYPDVITATFAENSNYTVSVVKGTFEIIISDGLQLTAEGYEGVYDGMGHAVEASANIEGAVISYSADGGVTWVTDVPSIVNVGQAIIRVKAELDGYRTVEKEVALTITPFEMVVKANDQTKDYGEADPEFTAMVYPKNEGQAKPDDGYEISYDEPFLREPGEDAGTYPIFASGYESQDGGNYKVTFQNGSLTIEAIDRPVEGEGAVTAEPYEGEYDAEAHTIQVNGLVDGDQVLYSYDGGETWVDDLNEYTDVTNQDILVKVTNPNYANEITVESYVIITQKPVIVKADSASKIYGTEDPELTAKVTGTLNGDTVEYYLEREPGEAVGNYGISATGETSQGNYSVEYHPGTFTITPADRVDKVTVTNYSGEYDAAEHTISVQGTVDSDLIEYSVDGETWVEEPILYTDVTGGVQEIQVRVTNPNYEPVDNLVGTVYIWPKTVTVTADDHSKVYGEADPNFTAAVEGTLNNDPIEYSFIRADGEDVGSYPIYVQGEEFQGNYQVKYIDGMLTITAADRTADIVVEDYTGVYDGQDHTIQVLNRADGDLVEYSYDGGNTWVKELEKYTDVTPGTGIVVKVTNFNYAPAEVYATGTVTITPFEMVVKADELTKNYGEADPEFTAKVYPKNEGQIKPEDGYEISYDEQFIRQFGEDAGTYIIFASGYESQDGGNYKVTFENGSLTILAISRPAEGEGAVTVEPYEGVYDANAHTIQVSNLAEGDQVQYSYDGGETWVDELREYTDVTALPIHVKVTNPNYVDDVEAGTYVIIKQKPVTVTARPASKVYGAEDPELTAEVSGTLNGDIVEYQVWRNAGEEVGNYEIIADGEASQGNYRVGYKPSTFTILPADRDHEITVISYRGQYDAEAHSIIVEGTVDGDVLQYSYDGGETWENELREYTDVTAEPQLIYVKVTNPNYEEIAPLAGTVYITPVSVTVTAQDSGKLYGEEDPALEAVVSGTLEGEENLIQYTVTRGYGETVGTYPIWAAGDAVQGNYQVAYVSAEFVIRGGVLYDGNGNTAGTAPVDENSYYTGDEITVLDKADLAKEDAFFLGWSLTKLPVITTAEEEAAAALIQPADVITMEDTGLVLYAVWAKDATGPDDQPDDKPDYHEFSVFYHANGGEGTMTDSRLYPEGYEYTVKENEFTREKFAFDGWNTAADGTGETVQPGDTLTMTADVNLYAQWEVDEIGETDPNLPDGIPDKYQVTFTYVSEDERYGTVTGKTVEVVTRRDENGNLSETAGVKPTVNVTVTENGRYRFDHWTDPAGTEYATEALQNTTFTTDTTFTAHYRYVSNSGHDGGGSSSGGGGGNPYNPSTGGPGEVIIDEGNVPLAPLPTEGTGTTIYDGDVPLAPLPKTGQQSSKTPVMMLLTGLFMAFAALTRRKEEKQ